MADKKVKLGALWLKSGQYGDYFTGVFGDQKIVVFKNKYKKEPKQPDFVIYESISKNAPPPDQEAEKQFPIDQTSAGGDIPF